VGGSNCGKRDRRVDMVEKCLQIYVNAKTIPVESVPGIRGGGIKESSGRGEFKYDTFATL
jgi:hypothetical protein